MSPKVLYLLGCEKHIDLKYKVSYWIVPSRTGTIIMAGDDNVEKIVRSVFSELEVQCAEACIEELESKSL